MRVSAKADYALRALIEMAARADGDGGRPVSAEELGRLQEIPHNFLQAILADLRKAGIVPRPARPVRRLATGRRPPRACPWPT